MIHSNAPLTIEGRHRLVARCRTRPIAHVAAEMGISRQGASKWVNRFRRHGELGLLDRSPVPHPQPTATTAEVLVRIEQLRRDRKFSAHRIATELAADNVSISVRTVTRHSSRLGLNRRRFLDPSGRSNRQPRRIVARRPGHMVHVDIKKVGRIPDGGGWRTHGRGSDHAKAVARAKTRGSHTGYMFLHTAVDGFSRLAYTEAWPDERAVTAIGFVLRARALFAAYGVTRIERIVTGNGACYKAHDFAKVPLGARHQRVTRYTPRRNGKVERDNRILVEEFLYAREWASEHQQMQRPWSLARSLQLPTSLGRRKPTPSQPPPHRRHQRHGLIHQLLDIAKVVAARTSATILDGLTGESLVDEHGKGKPDSHTATGFARPAPTDCALAWCALTILISNALDIVARRSTYGYVVDPHPELPPLFRSLGASDYRLGRSR